jgi:hypothetical protein
MQTLKPPLSVLIDLFLFSSANATDARNVLHPRPEQVDLVSGHLRQLRSSRNQKRINSTDAIFYAIRKKNSNRRNCFTPSKKNNVFFDKLKRSCKRVKTELLIVYLSYGRLILNYSYQ